MPTQVGSQAAFNGETSVAVTADVLPKLGVRVYALFVDLQHRYSVETFIAGLALVLTLVQVNFVVVQQVGGAQKLFPAVRTHVTSVVVVTPFVHQQAVRQGELGVALVAFVGLLEGVDTPDVGQQVLLAVEVFAAVLAFDRQFYFGAHFFLLLHLGSGFTFLFDWLRLGFEVGVVIVGSVEV